MRYTFYSIVLELVHLLVCLQYFVYLSSLHVSKLRCIQPSWYTPYPCPLQTPHPPDLPFQGI